MPNLTTEFKGPSRDLVSTIPGAGTPAPGPAVQTPGIGALDPNLLSRLLQAKLARQQAPTPSIRQEAPQQMPTYRPQMSSQAQAPFQPKTVTRMVNDPRVSPYFAMQYGRPAPAVAEKGYVQPDGRIVWEFNDGGGRGEGSSGGIDTRSAPSGGYSSSPLGDPRMAALNAQQDEASFGDQRRQAQAYQDPFEQIRAAGRNVSTPQQSKKGVRYMDVIGARG